MLAKIVLAAGVVALTALGLITASFPVRAADPATCFLACTSDHAADTGN
jgi:hypothetical protein